MDVEVSIVLCFAVLSFCTFSESSRVFRTLEPVKTYMASTDQTAAVNLLLQRVLGDRSKEVKAEVLPEPYDNDYVFVSTLHTVCLFSLCHGMIHCYLHFA